MAGGCILTRCKEPLCALIPALWEMFFNARCDIMAKGTVQGSSGKNSVITKVSTGTCSIFLYAEVVI